MTLGAPNILMVLKSTFLPFQKNVEHVLCLYDAGIFGYVWSIVLKTPNIRWDVGHG